MGILKVLFANSGKASRALSPEKLVDFPIGFKGELDHVTSLCVGCGTCEYVCSPGAINVEMEEGSHFNWVYQPVQCTFCGKCVEYCPTNALSLHQSAMENHIGRKEALVISHFVAYQKCENCGEPVIPLPIPTLEELYQGNLPKDLVSMMHLCDKCRNRATVKRMKSSLRGEYHPEGEK